MNNKKKLLFGGLLLLGIGFASVTTTLSINGTAKIKANDDDFKVVFTNTSAGDISDDGTQITFEAADTDTLSHKDDSYTLNFDVTNKSSLYDSTIDISCYTYYDGDLFDTSSQLDSSSIAAGDTISGSVTVKLLRPATSDENWSVTCELDAEAQEKDID
jgi:hypothetical protein